MLSPCLGLLAEIAVRAHARGLDHPPQRLLAPATARLVRAEHAAQLQRLVRERLALLRQRFQVLLHLAQRGGLRALGLLQPLLVDLELLLQRLDQRLDGLLAPGQIALPRLLQLGRLSRSRVR